MSDTLGFRYTLLPGDKDIALSEWEVYQDSNSNFAVAGKVDNLSEIKRFSLADIVVRFYRADGSVLGVESVPVSGRWVKPGETNRFERSFYIDMNQLDSYTLTIEVTDWQQVVE